MPSCQAASANSCNFLFASFHCAQLPNLASFAKRRINSWTLAHIGSDSACHLRLIKTRKSEEQQGACRRQIRPCPFQSSPAAGLAWDLESNCPMISSSDSSDSHLYSSVLNRRTVTQTLSHSEIPNQRSLASYRNQFCMPCCRCGPLSWDWWTVCDELPHRSSLRNFSRVGQNTVKPWITRSRHGQGESSGVKRR